MNNLDIAMLVSVGVVAAVVATFVLWLAVKLTSQIVRSSLTSLGRRVEEDSAVKVAAIVIAFAIIVWVTAGSFVQLALGNMP